MYDEKIWEGKKAQLKFCVHAPREPSAEEHKHYKTLGEVYFLEVFVIES